MATKETSRPFQEDISHLWLERFGIVPVNGDVRFGDWLKMLREGYWQRVSERRNVIPLKLSATKVLEELKKRGITYSSGSYSELENNIDALPRDIEEMASPLLEVLGVPEGSDLYGTSMVVIAYAALRQKYPDNPQFSLRLLDGIVGQERERAIAFVRQYNGYMATNGLSPNPQEI